VSRSAALAGRIGQLTGLAVREARVVGAQHGYQHLMLTLPGGRRAFAKAVAAPSQVPASSTGEVAAAFAAEANGLRWLAEAAAVPVPDVLAVGPRRSSSR
jgi:fructosamine-3-kinase